MKVEFENELKYTDLLLPTLEILSDNKNKTENEIINIFQKMRDLENIIQIVLFKKLQMLFFIFLKQIM